MTKSPSVHSFAPLLKRQGMRWWRKASNGRIGLALYRHRPADLVITEILMPELNGLDMLLELTREFLHAKVIAISGAGRQQNVLDAAKLLGARRTLQKPFSMPRLL